MASRDSMDVTADLIGRLVDDRYKVIEPMASGSMGAVYKGERVPVGKMVAIKFLHSAFAGEAEFLTRFERETRVMSKLAHPNCVSVVDFGVFEGAPYLVMDYVSGKTLRSILDDAPIDPMRALALIRQVASGLAHAHQQGVVHRDIKPANIMITDEIGTGEHARILDFGLARLRNAVAEGRDDATQTNVVVGTPNYMAPEQTVGGGTIDARTDIYAVGVVLFEMIAGVRPFQAEDTLALLGMHRAAPIPKLADRLDRTIILPNGVQLLIEKAMAKAPADRYQTAIELTNAIDEITGAKTATEPKGKVVHRTKTPMAGIDTAAVASTLYDVKTSEKTQPTKQKSNSFAGTFLAILVLAGGAGAAWYLFGRGNKQQAPKDAAQVALVDAPAATSTDAASPLPEIDAAPVGSGSGSDSGSGSGSGSAVESGSGSGSATVDTGSGSGSQTGSGSGSGEIEMEPDPEKVQHVAPKAPETDDEAHDAPKKDDEVEKKAPPAPVLAKTFPEVLALIKEGKSDLAITSLRSLGKFNPKNAHISWLLGNLYFDKGWWSVSLVEYRKAVTLNAKYGVNEILNRNVIRMLVSPKTRWAADSLLRKIGKPAVPYLRQAASSDRNAYVRNHAAGLAKALGGR